MSNDNFKKPFMSRAFSKNVKTGVSAGSEALSPSSSVISI
jgi:hypothetical protein